MTLVESLGVALRALRAHPLRSLLTMLGIIIGVAAVITMVAIGQGAEVRVEEQIRSLGANLLMVEPGAGREGGARLEGGTRHTLTERDALAIGRSIAGLRAVAPSARQTAQVVHGNRNWRTVVNGTWPEYFVAREWNVSSGRHFSSSEVNRAAKVVVIGATIADALFGDEDPISKIIRLRDVPLEVVGVLARKGLSGAGRDQDDIVFAPLATYQMRVAGGGHEVNREAVNYILIKAAHADALPTLRGRIAGLLRDRHRLPSDAPDDFRIWNPEAAMVARNESLRTFSILLASVASISLIVGGISIMNIMLVSVTERTREIGIRLAVGARRSDIRRQFLMEAVALCLVGGAIGVALGIGSAAAVSDLAGWALFISPPVIVLAVLCAAVTGVFFGSYPAVKASRLDPIEALRTE